MVEWGTGSLTGSAPPAWSASAPTSPCTGSGRSSSGTRSPCGRAAGSPPVSSTHPLQRVPDLRLADRGHLAVPRPLPRPAAQPGVRPHAEGRRAAVQAAALPALRRRPAPGPVAVPPARAGHVGQADRPRQRGQHRRPVRPGVRQRLRLPLRRPSPKGTRGSRTRTSCSPPCRRRHRDHYIRRFRSFSKAGKDAATRDPRRGPRSAGGEAVGAVMAATRQVPPAQRLLVQVARARTTEVRRLAPVQSHAHRQEAAGTADASEHWKIR
jgi:hypothetical protein